MSHGPYSRRSRSDDVEPISSYAAMRQAIAQQVRLTVRPEDTLGDVHARFTARLRCRVCSALRYANAKGRWVNNSYDDRERAESIVKSFTDPVDAALEFAAQQWDRLGRFMRMNAEITASRPEVAVHLQKIAISATDRANYLRKRISNPATPAQEVERG